MLLNKTRFSQFVGVSRQGLEKAIKSGRVIVRKDKKIDCKHPENIAYIAKHNDGVEKQPDPKIYKPPGVLRKDRKAKKIATNKKTSTKKRQPKNKNAYESPFPEDNEEVPNQLEYNNIDGKDIYNLSMEDLKNLGQNNLDKLKTIVDIRNKTIKTAKERGDLIPITLVQKVLGQLFIILRNELLQLGSNCSSEIAGFMKNSNTQSTLKTKKHIDKRTNKIVSHIDRKFMKFLKDIEPNIK